MHSPSIDERLSSAIAGSSDSSVAVNPLDSIFPRASVGSNAGFDYGRSFSPKTSQHFSFDQIQVVSPLRIMEKLSPVIWGNGGRLRAADYDPCYSWEL